LSASSHRRTGRHGAGASGSDVDADDVGGRHRRCDLTFDARALGGGRRTDGDALVPHSLLIALAFGGVLHACRARWRALVVQPDGGAGGALEATMPI